MRSQKNQGNDYVHVKRFRLNLGETNFRGLAFGAFGDSK